MRSCSSAPPATSRRRRSSPRSTRWKRRGHLEFPVIGVALSSGPQDDLPRRAHESIERYGGGVDPRAFATLAGRLRFVNGDYKDAATYTALRKELGESR